MALDLEDIPDDVREATYRLAGNMRLPYADPTGTAKLRGLVRDAEQQMIGLSAALKVAKRVLRKYKA